MRDTARGRRRTVLVLGWLALLIHLAVPVLPIYGSNHPFFWSRFPSGGTFVLQYFIASWSGAVALLVGLLMLRRERTGVTAGIFLAIAIVLIGTVANTVLPEPRDVIQDWRTGLVVGLEALEAVILFVAASIGTRRRY